MSDMISAKIICDSISSAGNRLTTFEIEVPRIVWSEFMTHRMFSRNAASSRAIPAKKMAEQLNGKPVRFGKNAAGMQDSGEHNALINGLYSAEEWWHLAKLSAMKFSEGFSEAGYAKQVFNRLTEPHQIMKAVVSATEFDNWFWLRDHDAADPTIRELAYCMKSARDASNPQALFAGEWHLPYVKTVRMDSLKYCLEEDGYTIFPSLELEDAIKVSCARCCAVSFRNIDYGLDKSREVYNRLVSDEKIHGSALEHAATPMKESSNMFALIRNEEKFVNVPSWPETWEKGISHMDREGNLWSGNYKGFIQYRKLIPGENYTVQKNG